MKKYDAIYGRQSVDRADSISIESQIEYCQYETRGGEYKVFQDKGYSGKNTDRPQFQQMLESIRSGEIGRVIVYKLDRISRSILDFSTMMEEFQKYGVEFVSCTEKFDTSTPMGRAMLNICIVFAQLERETIQMRVSDAYLSRSRRGFYMGGRIPYGYTIEPYMIDGKKTSRYVINPSEAEIVNLIFSMYAEPQVSIGDIARHLIQNQIRNSTTKDGSWDRSRISIMLKNPIYVKADLTIYKFFKEQGAILHNSPEDYIGTNGCYQYAEKGSGSKKSSLTGQNIVLAPHEGIVSSDTWIRARIKCLNNKQIAKPLKAKNSWLAGKIKCGKCGYAMNVRFDRSKEKRYLICAHKMKTHNCEGVKSITADFLEDCIFAEMLECVKEIGTLSKSIVQKEEPKIHDLNIRIEQKSEEIEKLLDKVANADGVLMEHINRRIHDLDAQLAALHQELSHLSASSQKTKYDIKQISDYMDHWSELSFSDKRIVTDQLIETVVISDDSFTINWTF